MPEQLPPELAAAALEAKSLARKNQTRLNIVCLVGVILGVAGLAVYAVITGATVGVRELVLAIALGVISAGAFLLLFSSRISPDHPLCPRCAYSWEIKEGRGVSHAEHMPYWDKCPGCGLPMRTELLKRHVKT